MNTRVCSMLISMVFSCVGAQVILADTEGAKDHPLVGRYKGSNIVYFKTSEFDESHLLKAPHDYAALLDKNATGDRSGPDWLKVEGRVTEIRYELPQGRSSLEVIRNYESALKSKGFSVLFSCSDAACLTGHLQDLYLLGQQLDPTNNISTAYSGHARYLLAKLDQPQGAIYASILAGEESANGVAFVKVVETKDIEGDAITVIGADEMKTTIQSGGSVNVYGILFDYDKDVIRPDSKPTLDEIAKLLVQSPEMRLKIVGHTDNKGSADYNAKLSSRRAANVVAALVSTYSIDASRLSAEGAGMSRPIAPNDTEEGRAKNRRVELLAQ